jgi:CRP/FNR family cyclic AMP-dependent transcriptional regulator
MSMKASLAEYLKNTALFAGFNDRQITGVLSIANERRFAAGAPIIRQGESGLGFYLIVEGRTEARAGEAVLAQFGPGDYFGEVALLLEDVPRTADVAALEDTSCLVITQWAFKSLLAAHPDMASAVMAELARRLGETPRTLAE